MKSYEKPRLMVLSISANDAICGGCQVSTRNDAWFKLMDSQVGNQNGVFELGEGGLFANAEDNCSVPTDYNGYCKFSGADGYKLFTS